jgi:hypothetical protein
MRQIAADMDVSKSAILGQIHRNGVGAEARKAAQLVREEKAKLAKSHDGKTRYNKTSTRPARAAKAPTPIKQSALTGGLALSPRAAHMPYEPRAPLPLVCEPVGLMDLRENNCHWVIDGRGEDGLALYCGASTAVGRSWCSAHHRIVYETVSERRAKRGAA